MLHHTHPPTNTREKGKLYKINKKKTRTFLFVVRPPTLWGISVTDLHRSDEAYLYIMYIKNTRIGIAERENGESIDLTVCLGVAVDDPWLSTLCVSFSPSICSFISSRSDCIVWFLGHKFFSYTQTRPKISRPNQI